MYERKNGSLLCDIVKSVCHLQGGRWKQGRGGRQVLANVASLNQKLHKG